MPARKREVDPDKYIDPRKIPPRDDPPSPYAVSLMVPAIVKKLGTSMVKQAEEKPDWNLYRVEIRDGNPFIVREMCDRCGKVWIPPKWRKIRACDVEDIGKVYLETGICKDCINASVYVDKYLDGDVLTEKEAKELFYKYAVEYERAWRVVIAAAPDILMTEDEWHKRCTFFRGCAICGGPIEVRAKYFPAYLNGRYAPWNVIPLCSTCMKQHYAGRTTKGKAVSRYKVFSTNTFFQKSKEIRLYLLNEMDKYGIYNEPLAPFRKRFLETKKIEETYL